MGHSTTKADRLKRVEEVLREVSEVALLEKYQRNDYAMHTLTVPQNKLTARKKIQYFLLANEVDCIHDQVHSACLHETCRNV